MAFATLHRMSACGTRRKQLPLRDTSAMRHEADFDQCQHSARRFTAPAKGRTSALPLGTVLSRKLSLLPLLFNQVLTKRCSSPAQPINQSSLTRPRSHRGSDDVVKYAARYHCNRCPGRLPLTGRLFPFQPSGFREASAIAAAASYQGEWDETASAIC